MSELGVSGGVVGRGEADFGLLRTREVALGVILALAPCRAGPASALGTSEVKCFLHRGDVCPRRGGPASVGTRSLPIRKETIAFPRGAVVRGGLGSFAQREIGPGCGPGSGRGGDPGQGRGRLVPPAGRTSFC